MGVPSIFHEGWDAYYVHCIGHRWAMCAVGYRTLADAERAAAQDDDSMRVEVLHGNAVVSRFYRGKRLPLDGQS